MNDIASSTLDPAFPFLGFLINGLYLCHRTGTPARAFPSRSTGSAPPTRSRSPGSTSRGGIAPGRRIAWEYILPFTKDLVASVGMSSTRFSVMMLVVVTLSCSSNIYSVLYARGPFLGQILRAPFLFSFRCSGSRRAERVPDVLSSGNFPWASRATSLSASGTISPGGPASAGVHPHPLRG